MSRKARYSGKCKDEEGFRKYYGDFFHQVAIENRIARKFEKAGLVVYPEISLEKGAEVIGCAPDVLLSALRNRRLRGRNVKGVHLIRLADLWDFAVALEKKKARK